MLRNASLAFDAGAHVEIDSLFENCTITLGEGTELVVGDAGVLADCNIAGAGSITVNGQFFERESPGIVGPRELVVSRGGALVASVQQVPALTRFRFERGSRLRVKIVNGRAAARLRKADDHDHERKASETLIEEGTELKGTLSLELPGGGAGPARGGDDRSLGRRRRDAACSPGERQGRPSCARAASWRASSTPTPSSCRAACATRPSSAPSRWRCASQRTDGRLEVMFGECELAVGEAPDKAAAIREATAAAAPAAMTSVLSARAPPPNRPRGGGEVTVEAEASPSTRNGRRKRADDGESQAENV